MRRFFAALLILAVATVPALAIDPCAHPILWKLFHPFRQVPPCPSPGPGPSPQPPIPPQPAPDFNTLLKAAYAVDTTPNKDAVIGKLAAYFTTGSQPLIANPIYTTTKELNIALKPLIDAAAPPGTLMQVYPVIVAELNSTLGSGSVPLTDAERAQVKAEFLKIGAALTALIPAPTPTPAPIPLSVPPKAAEAAPEQAPFVLPPIYLPQQPIRDLIRGFIIFRMIRRMR